MKPILTLIILYVTCQGLSAQWKVGPSVAYGVVTQESAKINVFAMDNYQNYNLEYAGASAVRSIGFMAINDLGPVFLQTGLMATTYGLDFVVSGYKSMERGQHLFREQFYNLEIPFNAGVKFHDFRIGLGPVMDLSMDIDSELAAIPDYKNTSKSVDFGFQGMIGYSIGVFNMDIKYINKFSSITDGFAFGFDEFKYKKSANRLLFAIGVTF